MFISDTILIICIIIFAILTIFFDAAMIHWATKIFKIKKIDYKIALKISIIGLLLGATLSFIVGFLSKPLNVTNAIGDIFLTIASFVVLTQLLKRYYAITLNKSAFIYLLYTVLIITIPLIIILPVRYFVIQPFNIEGSAMAPTLMNHEYTLVKIFDKQYERNDIVVFEYPKESQKFFIKRVIGLPNEKIQIKNGDVYIYNKKNIDGLKLQENYLSPNTKTHSLNTEIINIENDKYYILGDNRVESKDSRSFGVVDKDLILGKYWFSVPYWLSEFLTD